ncbi:MAG TPA: 4Fe-4S binding protein [Anaeromyxobacteraceae bacterium]|nr:4Fe-4S binding protein [Anaeromyxobacteraceae bacterium]
MTNDAARSTAPASPDAPAPTAPAAPPRWKNPWRALPRLRWAVQLAYLAFLVLVGWEFVRFAGQAAGDGPITASRPPAVEGFLPIAALVGLRRLLATGYWDEVHPAGLTILLAAVGAAFAARKGFCAWVCPVGTVERALEALGRRTLWRRRWPAVPRWLDLPLSGLKVLLLAFFVVTVFVQMPLDAVAGFLRAPFNLVADAKMLEFFRSPSATALAVFGFLAALSLVVKHAWCRWLCPYGALLGLAGLLSPLSVRRDPEACTDCRACTRACPAEIQVHSKLRVLSSECTGCLSCVAACGSQDCLTLTRKGRRGLPPWLLPAAVVGVMLGAFALASATGFWQTAVSPETFRWAYRVMGIGAAP